MMRLPMVPCAVKMKRHPALLPDPASARPAAPEFSVTAAAGNGAAFCALTGTPGQCSGVPHALGRILRSKSVSCRSRSADERGFRFPQRGRFRKTAFQTLQPFRCFFRVWTA